MSRIAKVLKLSPAGAGRLLRNLRGTGGKPDVKNPLKTSFQGVNEGEALRLRRCEGSPVWPENRFHAQSLSFVEGLLLLKRVSQVDFLRVF